MKKGNRLLAALLCLAMILSLLPASALAATAEDPKSSQFVVLSTTDVHGKCWDRNILNDTNVNNSLLHAATAVKGIRETYGKENVLLVDNGDLYQGTPVSSFNINQYTQGLTKDMNPMALCLEYMGYDAAVMGNHEFNYSWNTMTDIYKHLQANGVSTICANLYYTDTGKRVFTPYIIKTMNMDGHAFNVAVIGIENTDCTRWDVPDNYPGISFSDPVNNPSRDVSYEVNKVIDEMAANGVAYDYLIVSYHSGLGSVSGDLVYGSNTENQVLRVIANTTEVDMVIAGHDHSSSYSGRTYANKDGSKNVLVVNAGGSSLTQSVFNVSYGEDGFTVSTESSKNLSLSNYAADAELKAIVKPYADQASAYVNTSVGTLGEGWDSAYGSYSNSKYYLVQSDTIDLINRTQIWSGNRYLNQKYESVEALNAKLREIYGNDTTKQYHGSKLEVDMSSTSIVSSGATKSGALSMKGVYGFYKYDNSLYLLALTGREIKDLLEYNASKRLSARVSGGKVTYSTTGDGFTNPVFYGLNFTYDMYRPEGDRVVISGFSNGKTFDLNETYVFAINNYHLGNAGNDELGKYTTAQSIWSQTDDLGGGYVQDLIAEYVGEMTETYGCVYPTASAAKNGETPSTWSLSYSGDLSKVEVSDKTAFIGNQVTELTDGSQILFYNASSGTTVGLESGYNGRGAVQAAVISSKIYAEQGAAAFTVGITENGITLKCQDGYLTSSGRNNLSLSETPSANSYWTVEPAKDGFYVKNMGSSVYLEYYGGAFTTYSTGNKGAVYIFNFYQVATSAALAKADSIVEGDNLVIYYPAGGSVISGTPSGSRLSPVSASAVDTKTSSILEVPQGAAIFQVGYTDQGYMTLKTEAGYLTSGATGNSLSLSATATDYSLWELKETQGGYYVHNVNAAYNGNKNQYLEYYNGFTTYGLNTSNKAIYTYGLYKVGAMGSIPEEKVKGYVLPVFQTSDVHGFLLDTSSGVEDTYQYRMAYIADKVNDARNGNHATTLLLDGGDIYQGNVVSNLQNGAPLMAAYDLMGYDAVSLGNHEFDWGVETIVDSDGTMGSYAVGDYEGNSNIPVLASNLYKDGEKPAIVQDYVIVNKIAVDAEGNQKPVKIGVIGYIANYASDIMHAMFTGAGYTVKTDYEALEALAVKLETQLGCDATVVLTHGGASACATGLGSNSVVDLICGGHTHTNQTGSVGDLDFIQPANQATAYAYAELVFDEGQVSVHDAKTVSVTNDTSKLYDTAANADELDPEIVALSHAAVAGVADTLNETLGYFTTSITKTNVKGNSSTAGNWMTDLMNRAVNADVSFTNNGGIRTTFSIPKGAEYAYLTAGDVYTIAPFCNAIYVYDITYADLLSILEFSLNDGRALSLRMSGIDCYYTGTTVKTLVKDGTVIYQDGVWTDDWNAKTVRVSTNEYVATSTGTPFVKWNDTDALVSKDTIDNEAMIAALKQERTLHNGYLFVDPNPHMISGVYEAPTTHEHAYLELTFAPTETEYGYTAHICEYDGAYYESDIIPPLNGQLTILEQPTDYAGAMGGNAIFCVAVNKQDVTYQWMYSNNGGTSWVQSGMTGSNTDTLSVKMLAFRMGQMYKCVITDAAGDRVETVPVSMTVPQSTIVIVTEPVSFTGAVGSEVSFAVEATGDGLTYQWMYSNNSGSSWTRSTAPGSDTDTISTDFKAYREGQMYKCVISDQFGNTLSSAAVTMIKG